MTNYEKFKQQFEKDYESIGDFDEKVIDNANATIPYNGKLELNKDKTFSDSYGDEETYLESIYYFEDFDIYVGFYGNYSSYNGRKWHSMKEVKPVQKIINTFE